MTSVMKGARRLAMGLATRFLAAGGVFGLVLAHGSWTSTSAASAASATPIQHVVIILKENRSFDHYFGRLPGVRGTSTGLTHTGTRVSLVQPPDPFPHDVGHSTNGWYKAWDNGKMDGFDLESTPTTDTGLLLPYTSMREGQIPSYWAYARKYAIGDNFFSPWKGPSFANNMFSVAGQAGQFDTTNGRKTIYDVPFNPLHEPVAGNYWGCDSPDGTLVRMEAPDGSISTQFPCFNYRGLPNVLSNHGVSWKFYTPHTKNDLHNALDALKPVRYAPALWRNITPLDQFYTDAAGASLPNIMWVNGNSTEHPPYTACAGENETVRIVNALMTGPNWKSTAIFIYWDEWGGMYDHVAPPSGYGFRVPFLVISPWTKHGSLSNGGYVTHTFYSVPSIHAFIEHNWSLPSLTPLDAAASNLMDAFDFTQLGRGKLLRTTRTCNPPPANVKITDGEA
jgi:phospholipase C